MARDRRSGGTLSLGLRGAGLMVACLLALLPVSGARATFAGRDGALAGKHQCSLSLSCPVGSMIYLDWPPPIENRSHALLPHLAWRDNCERGMDEWDSGTVACYQRDPAWSPRGDRLAFANSDHIAVIGANTRTELTAAQGRGPSWSPDGSRLVFELSSGGLATVRPDGADVRALRATGSDPSWGSNGRIAYVNRGSLYVTGRDGSRPDRRVASGGVSDPDWSPGASRIAYTRGGRVNTCCQRPGRPWTLEVVDTSGGRIWVVVVRTRRAVPLGRLPGRGPAWSPDGRGIVYSLPFGNDLDQKEAYQRLGSHRRPTVTGAGSGDADLAWQALPRRR